MKCPQAPRTPSFRHHKATNQGHVDLHGRRIYPGRFDRPETRQKYYRLIAEWDAARRRPPVAPDQVTVNELAAYWEHAEAYYSVESREVADFRLAVRRANSTDGLTCPSSGHGRMALPVLS